MCFAFVPNVVKVPAELLSMLLSFPSVLGGFKS